VASISHYDVISASWQLWKTQPFTVTGMNGYLDGRGVMDNKGPILAAACAASDLLRKCLLGCDIVFLIEGEEEAVSGYADAVWSHKVCVGRTDALRQGIKLSIYIEFTVIGDVDVLLIRYGRFSGVFCMAG
jgi:Peptidase family M20/M25/M40